MLITKFNKEQPAIYFLILAMCVSMELYFTWRFPQSLVNFACALVLLPCLLKVKVPQQSLWVIFLLIINFIYNYTHNTVSFSFLSFLNLSSVIIISIFIVLSSIAFKIKLWHGFDWFMKCICCISLIGWFLYLAGIPLPHYYSDTTDFYTHVLAGRSHGIRPCPAARGRKRPSWRESARSSPLRSRSHANRRTLSPRLSGPVFHYLTAPAEQQRIL